MRKLSMSVWPMVNGCDFYDACKTVFCLFLCFLAFLSVVRAQVAAHRLLKYHTKGVYVSLLVYIYGAVESTETGKMAGIPDEINYEWIRLQWVLHQFLRSRMLREYPENLLPLCNHTVCVEIALQEGMRQFILGVRNLPRTETMRLLLDERCSLASFVFFNFSFKPHTRWCVWTRARARAWTARQPSNNTPQTSQNKE